VVVTDVQPERFVEASGFDRIPVQRDGDTGWRVDQLDLDRATGGSCQEHHPA